MQADPGRGFQVEWWSVMKNETAKAKQGGGGLSREKGG